ncbi:glycosyltransferase family 4 protein [Chloroflexus islandicus]|uniref:glycosyltransferase family 4 protein n=1 Tax=Chloroflexus islandicus TaxID=1707952 RepID=UPI0009EF3BCF|nr:glycosyltransferase family 4 protein [Chloroflexus islandicus]
MIQALFVLEQHLGHRTYAENLRFGFAHQSQITAQWANITYYDESGWIERLPLPANVRGMWRGRQQVRQALRAATYDVALFNTQVPAALAGKLVHRRPYLLATDITPRQYDAMAALYQHRADRAGPLAAVKHWLNTRLFQRAAWVLPWSRWAGEALIREYGVSPERVCVIPPGIDLSRWRPQRDRATDSLRILFVGGDFERKGGPTLLAALRLIKTSAEVEVHIVTRSAVEPAERMFIYRNLPPNAPQLIELYQQADIFVFPTHAEAFGIAAVEAIACGVPVIATPIGGLPDIVHDGSNGFLVPPDDPAALAARLQLLIDQPETRARMAHAARRHAEQHFDVIHNAARIAELMAHVVRDGQRCQAQANRERSSG